MFVEKLVSNCNKDWNFFGNQEFNIAGDEIHTGKKEFESMQEKRIGEY